MGVTFLCKNLIVAYVVFPKLVMTTLSDYFPVLDEKVAFRVQWPGKTFKMNAKAIEDVAENALSITTEDQESYFCILPTLEIDGHSRNVEMVGPNPLKLLKPLFSPLKCTLKIEQFWTYELCHGRFIRQYHREITLDEKIHQEFLLGKMDPSDLIYDDEPINSESEILQKITVDGKKLHYVGINMTDGTMCDLNGQPRFAHVMYVCHEDGYNEIHSINEAPSCEYEVIVLSPLLCVHPAFRKNSQTKSDINCYPVDDSPIKPNKLLQKEVIKTDELPLQKDANASPKEEISTQPQDHSLINDLLNGEHCLQGGTGWWRYEFCYGKKALQFHDDNGVRTTIVLGTWNIDNHLLWIAQNPHKRPKKGESIKQVSHMYTEGSFCDETGKPRQVEVRLKCKDAKDHPNSISMYLLEPRPCEYILPITVSTR